MELFPPGLLTLCPSCRTASKGRSASARPGLAYSPDPSPGVSGASLRAALLTIIKQPRTLGVGEHCYCLGPADVHDICPDTRKMGQIVREARHIYSIDVQLRLHEPAPWRGAHGY